MYKLNKETLLWEEDDEKIAKYRFFQKTSLGFAITIIVLLFFFNATAQKNKDTIQHQAHEIKCLKSNLDSLSKTKDLPLTLKTVDWIIDQLPFKNKAEVKKQYRLESGNLKSKLVFTNWNIFGMRNASSRPQAGCKSPNNNYRHYDHFVISIFDRCLYELKYGTSLKGYATDPNYKAKLK